MIKEITLGDEKFSLSNSLDFEIRCQNNFGHPSVKILNDAVESNDLLATVKVAYSMITPKPTISFEEFCKKVTPSNIKAIGETIASLIQDGMPTPKQEEKIKN